MADAAEWLRTKVSKAPVELVQAMQRAVPVEDPLSVPQALARAASSLYDEVVRGNGGRGAALPLLAADALLTHAFEAQAELDPEGLSSLAAAWTEELGRIT